MTGRTVGNQGLISGVAVGNDIDIQNSIYSGNRADIDRAYDVNTNLGLRATLDYTIKPRLSFNFESFAASTGVTTLSGLGFTTTAVGRTYDNLDSDGTISLSIPLGPKYNATRANTFLDLTYSVDAYSPGFGKTETLIGNFSSGTLNAYTTVKPNGNTSDPYPIITPVTATTDTGVLGIALCTSSCDLSSVGAGSPWWVVVTKGPLFIPGLTGGTVGQVVYYTAAGVITLTALGNVAFGTIVATSLTGATINFPTPSFA